MIAFAYTTRGSQDLFVVLLIALGYCKEKKNGGSGL